MDEFSNLLLNWAIKAFFFSKIATLRSIMKRPWEVEMLQYYFVLALTPGVNYFVQRLF